MKEFYKFKIDDFIIDRLPCSGKRAAENFDTQGIEAEGTVKLKLPIIVN